MPTLEEMLNEIDNSPSLYELTNDVFTIDPETRVINVPATESLFGVESDEKTERKHFQCPKIVGDNIDLSTMGLRINYENAIGDKNSYPVTDMKAEGENITFSWLLGRDVTAYAGTIHFIVCAIKVDDGGVITNEWNTTIAEGISIVGLEVEEEATEEEQTLIEQLIAQSLQKITEMNNLMSESEAKVNQAVNNANSSASNADEKAQEAETAAENANEAAQQVFDEAYILTAETTFNKEATITPTAYGNALIEQIEGDTWQGENPSPENPQYIYGLGDTGYFDGVWQNGAYAEVNGDYVPGTGKEYVCNVNPIRVNPNDSVTIQYAENIYYILCGFYKEDMTYIKSEKAQGADVLNCTAPLESYWMNVTLQAQFMAQPPITIDVTKVKHCSVLINNNYAIKLETRGKNLIDFDKYYVAYGSNGEYQTTADSFALVRIDIPDEYIGKTVTFSAMMKISGNLTQAYVAYIRQHTTFSGNGIRNINDYELSKISFTVQEGDTISVLYGSNGNNTVYVRNPQLEVGETVTEYIPYQGGRINLPISSPLYEGDSIVKINGVYKIRRVNGVAVFDGSEDEEWWTSNVAIYQAFGIQKVGVLSDVELKCNRLLYIHGNPVLLGNAIGISNVSGGANNRIYVANGISENLPDFKTWLQSNPITVVYKLVTPVYEEIPQEPFYNLMAGEEVTTIQVLGENDNLELNNKVRFPRHTDGAIATTGFAEAKKNSILLEEQTQTLEQRIQTLETLTLEGE